MGGWPDAAAALETTGEIIFVSYVTVLANFLSESDMIDWADTIIACTGGYMANEYVEQPSNEFWESPPSWASTGQYLVAQVKK